MIRVLTAAVLIPTVIFVILFGPPLLFQLVVALLGFACFREYARIAAAQNIRLPVWLGHAAGMAVLFSPLADWRLFLAFAMLATVWAMRAESLADSLPQAAVLLLGIIYIYGSWRCAPFLRTFDPWWVFYAVSLNWVGDTAAMVAGKTIGKRSFAPVISPKKTWEGSIASALFVTLYGAALLAFVLPSVPLWEATILSFLAGVAGQLGDLAESAMKRGGGVKDSGAMLPGHGGWLDRLDSSLFSMPVVAFYLTLQPLFR